MILQDCAWEEKSTRPDTNTNKLFQQIYWSLQTVRRKDGPDRTTKRTSKHPTG
jgi:hypothetical protein